MSLITTPKGDTLLEFHAGSELDVPESDKELPMPLALVVAKHQGKTLFIFNQWRKVWELPGGIIEAGETPQQAAIRELAEESSQVVASVDYVGWMKFRLKPDERLELAALYRCELETLQSFQVSDEASAMMLWDMVSPVEKPVSEIDLYLAKLVI